MGLRVLNPVATAVLSLSLLLPVATRAAEGPAPLRVGAASVAFEASNDMEIAGGITARLASSQEGELRATATVFAQEPYGRFAIVACDVLMLTRDLLDPVVTELEVTAGIPANHILINATHTHHAPSTVKIHGYDRDEVFCREVQQGIVKAVHAANNRLSTNGCEFVFSLQEESTIGQNSRLLMPDGMVRWIGSWREAVRPTGPMDPELPVLGFRRPAGDYVSVLFNHSTHTIGMMQPGVRSPSFYGLAAQHLEQEFGGVFCFLEGASGSTHRLKLSAPEALERVKETVTAGLGEALPRPVRHIASRKRLFEFQVRVFDELAEDRAVRTYCRKYAGARAETIIDVFRKMRRELAPIQGTTRETWLQVMLIGDVAIVGVPAEFFTKLGLDIKNRSPFRYTYIAELANDWIGYLPDLDAHHLGGYQVWTGLHSYTAPGTGERMVDEVVDMLTELAGEARGATKGAAHEMHEKDSDR